MLAIMSRGLPSALLCLEYCLCGYCINDEVTRKVTFVVRRIGSYAASSGFC